MPMLLTPHPNTYQIFSPQICTDHKTGNFEINGPKTGIPAKPERLSSLILRPHHGHLHPLNVNLLIADNKKGDTNPDIYLSEFYEVKTKLTEYKPTQMAQREVTEQQLLLLRKVMLI